MGKGKGKSSLMLFIPKGFYLAEIFRLAERTIEKALFI